MTSFRPLRWLRSPHLQTIVPAVPLFSPPRSHSVESVEELRIPVAHRAGEPMAHRLHARAWWAEGVRPAVLILHGIAGSKDSHCAVRAAVACHRSGYHAVRLDMRGAGDSVVDAPSLYHAGLTTDLDLAVRHLAKDPRVSGVLVLGFSGGGSQALKLAGEWGSAPPPGVLAVATVSAPLDYTRVAARMDTLACLPYRFHVLRGLLDRAQAFATHHPDRAHYDATTLAAIKRFRGFDGEIIVPMHGFEDVDDYYWEASAGRWLDRIQVPTLLLHAEDDPMVPIETVRPWLRAASSVVKATVSKHGGHIGWLAGFDESSWIKGWATREMLKFFAERGLPPPPVPMGERPS
jgi:uncharacterized protein